MRILTLVIAASALLIADGSLAAGRTSDVDYLRANRCRGLATRVRGLIDAQALDSFLRTEARGRSDLVQLRASAEYARARRDAAGGDLGKRLAGELSGVCQAFVQPMGAEASCRSARCGVHYLWPM